MGVSALVDRMFDIAVIGGGISGLGIAAEAAAHGFSVLLFERGKFSAATSAHSLRIIHGGLRYLQQFDIPRVLESAQAQHEILSRYPKHVSPLPCVTPLASSGLKSRFPMMLAAYVYRALTERFAKGAQAPRLLGFDELRREVPALTNRAPFGAFSWWDALVENPAVFAAEIAREAREAGAVLHEERSVSAVHRGENGFRLEVQGFGSTDRVSSRCVVDATGPWLQRVVLDQPLPQPKQLSWCRAFNLLLRARLDPRFGIGIESDEKRLYFAVPRGEQGVLGTGYLPFEGMPETASISDREVRAFLESFNRAWPEAGVSLHDVVGVECGVLPMRRIGPRGPELLGREELYNASGFISVVSTKYTTFRMQAKAVLRLASAYLR